MPWQAQKIVGPKNVSKIHFKIHLHGYVNYISLEIRFGALEYKWTQWHGSGDYFGPGISYIPNKTWTMGTMIPKTDCCKKC